MQNAANWQGYWGHKDEQCKGQCNICQKWGHTQKDCFSVEKIEAKKAKIKAKNKARKTKAKITKAKAKITKPESPKACFNLSLPEYVESSDSSQSSTCNKKTPAKVPDTYGMLPNSSSDASSKPKEKQTSNMARKNPQKLKKR